jgi:hypothetical protein
MKEAHISHRSGNLTPITFYTTAKPRAGVWCCCVVVEIGASGDQAGKKREIT